jgi:ubiquitin carboxyl-terminal hydrolase 25
LTVKLTTRIIVVEELHELFTKLESTPDPATRPTQRLANAVVMPARQLMKAQETTSSLPVDMLSQFPQPPPLPARPPPTPPMRPRSTVQHIEDVDMVGGDEVVSDTVDASSVRSSQTLVNVRDIDSDQSYEKVDVINPIVKVTDTAHATSSATLGQAVKSTVIQIEDEAPTKTWRGSGTETDAIMIDVDTPDDDASIDEKVLKGLERQDRSGTAQQDVEEFMGSVINLLQSAIKPNATSTKDKIQWDSIMETFFVTNVNYTKKEGDSSYTDEVTLDRYITAYPAEDGPCMLYDALDRNFDQQIIEGINSSRFTAIRQLPGILHVLIQRTTGSGRKNHNPVIIDDVLFLDRYMDSPEILGRRQRSWEAKKRIEKLRAEEMQTKQAPASANCLMSTLPHQLAATEDEFDEGFGLNTQMDSDSFSFEGEGGAAPEIGITDLSKNSILPPPPPALTENLTEVSKISVELQRLEQAISENFAGSESHAYLLHAVICHRGALNSGHYWVWIYDFEHKVWRKYNDENVIEEPTTENVLQALNREGEPYYLCYVRKGEEGKLVNVPRRRPTDAYAIELDAERGAMTSIMSPKPDGLPAYEALEL